MPTTAESAPPAALQAQLADAEARHASAPAEVAAWLLAYAASLPADADGARALRLAEHVALAHLGEPAALAAVLAALPAAQQHAEPWAAALQRAHWVLAMVQPSAGAALPPAPADLPRWRALQNIVQALAAQGRCAEAAVLLAADEAAAATLGRAPAAVAYASSADNIAVELQTGGRPVGAARDVRRDAARDALMLQAAAIARRAWGHAGTWLHAERAEYRLALCHAVAGQGEQAVQHAQLCLAACQAAGSEADAVEHFFAHEAMARAQRAAGALAEAAAARARMAALLPAIAEADGLRAWCADALASVPAYHDEACMKKPALGRLHQAGTRPHRAWPPLTSSDR